MSHKRSEAPLNGGRDPLTHGLQLITRSEMSRIEGGRCWDGPLGDREECPPKPTSRGSFVITSIEHFASETIYET
jgi:hypothetical protein